MQQYNSVARLFLRLSFLPFCFAVLVMLGYHTLKQIYHVNQSQAQEAQRIADMMAVIAAKRPLPVNLMAEQVNALLNGSETLASVNFYPLDQPLPAQIEQKHMFDEYLSKNAAVMVANTQPANALSLQASGISVQNEVAARQGDSSEGDRLMGYINVTMDMKKAHAPIIRSALIELVVSFVVLALIFLLLFYMFTGTSSVLRHLVGLSRKVVDGENNIYLVEHQRSKTNEMRLFEDALVALSTRYQLLQDKFDSTQKINQLLSKREHTLQHQKDTFQSLVTHELRTPLNAISGGLQLLETQKLDAASKDSLSLIRKGEKRLGALLDDIISLNNLQQGKVELVESQFNPEDVLRSLAEQYSQVCLRKQLQLSVDIKHTAVELVADYKNITQVLDYLLDNAVKFTQEGTITITSQIIHTNNNTLHWLCEVIDTGIGIHPRLHKDIFKAYVQSDTGHSRAFEGSGLGLTLAEKLTELLSGHISLASTVDEGSTFRLSVPVKDATQAGQMVVLDGISLVHIHTGKTAGFARALQKFGAMTYEYSDIQRAQAMLANERVDVVTISSHFDAKQASDIARMIRAQEFESRSLIVYFVPADQALDELLLSSTGIDHWITYTNSTDVAARIVSWTDRV